MNLYGFKMHYVFVISLGKNEDRLFLNNIRNNYQVICNDLLSPIVYLHGILTLNTNFNFTHLLLHSFSSKAAYYMPMFWGGLFQPNPICCEGIPSSSGPESAKFYRLRFRRDRDQSGRLLQIPTPASLVISVGYKVFALIAQFPIRPRHQFCA